MRVDYATAAVPDRPKVSRAERRDAALGGIVCGAVGLSLTAWCWVMLRRGTLDPGVGIAAVCLLASGVMRLLSAFGLLETDWAPWRRRTSRDDG